MERLIATNGGATVWEATDLIHGCRVELVLTHATQAQSSPTPPPTKPRLELVEISDEDAFFDEPPAPELFEVPIVRPRPWWLLGAIAGIAVVAAIAGFQAMHPRHAAEATLTRVTEPVATATATMIPPPPPPVVIERSTSAAAASPAEQPRPATKPRPKWTPPQRKTPPPPARTSDPITL
jgi:hypothetical protein